MVSPVCGYLSVGNAPQVIQSGNPPQLLFPLNHITVLCHILGPLMLYIAGKDNYGGGRGGVVTDTFTRR